MDRRMTKQQTEELREILTRTQDTLTAYELSKFLDEYGYRSPSERHG